MDRKYPRVERGAGAFHHPPRASYSEETKSLIKILMEESKLSMMQRKSIQEAINRGESLPVAPSSANTKLKKDSDECQVTMPCFWKKRSKEIIVNSGAYEREQYRRTYPLINKEKEKRHLACIMAYGKEMPETPHGPRILHKARKPSRLPENVDPLDDLVQGIRERLEFLSDMECLGMGKKYQPIIQQEIAEKMRMIESLDKQRSKELRKEVQSYKYERPPPKPFPLGEFDDN